MGIEGRFVVVIILLILASAIIPSSFAVINYQDPIHIDNSGGMSFNGNIVAVGNQLYDIQGNNIRTFVNPNLEPGSSWGNSVDIDGNLILIGQSYGPLTVGGSAFLFDINTGELLHSFYPPPPIIPESHFGFSVALSGDKAIVTSAGKFITSADPDLTTRTTYVFDVTSGSLLYTINSPNENKSHFGWCVDADGDKAIIGESRGLNFGGNGPPSAHLFDLTDGSLLQSYFPPIGAGDRFATSVSISDDRVLIGDDSSSVTPSGYLYDTSGNVLYTFPKPLALGKGFSGCQGDDIEADLVLIGRPFDVTSDIELSGSAYLYDISGNLQNIFSNPDPVHDDEFGNVVELSNSNVIIGEGPEGRDEYYLYLKDANSELTVKSEDESGNTITGHNTILKQEEITLETGVTPINFQLYNGDTFTVEVQNNGNFHFHHWKDTGSTDNIRDIAIASDTQLIAVYRDITIPLTDSDGDGFPAEDGIDCNDSNSEINPNAEEVGDGIDNNCNGEIDEGFIDQDEDGLPFGEDCDDSDSNILGPVIFYVDSDGDSFGNPTNSQLACIVPPGFVDNGNDCNDASSNSHPGAPEIDGDQKDNDCDGLFDESDLGNDSVILQIQSQIQDILASILGLDTRVTELEERVLQLENLIPDDNTTPNLTVKAIDSNGNTRSLWTVLRQNGQIIDTGFTPQTNTITSGTQYTVSVSNYNQFTFDRWEDGSTANPRTFSIVSDKTLTAFFNAP